MLWSLGYTYNRPIGILHIGFNIVLEGKVKGIPLKDFKELVSVNGEKREKRGETNKVLNSEADSCCPMLLKKSQNEPKFKRVHWGECCPSLVAI